MNLLVEVTVYSRKFYLCVIARCASETYFVVKEWREPVTDLTDLHGRFSCPGHKQVMITSR